MSGGETQSSGFVKAPPCFPNVQPAFRTTASTMSAFWGAGGLGLSPSRLPDGGQMQISHPHLCVLGVTWAKRFRASRHPLVKALPKEGMAGMKGTKGRGRDGLYQISIPAYWVTMLKTDFSPKWSIIKCTGGVAFLPSLRHEKQVAWFLSIR